MKLIKFLLSMLILLFCTTIVIAQSCEDHPWKNSPPVKTFYYDYYDKPLPKKSWLKISDSGRQEAIRLLKDVPFRRINKDEILKLTGNLMPEIKGESYFIVRALRDTGNIAQTGVYLFENKLMVESSGIGTTFCAEKIPLIVSLKIKPDDLYVFC